MMTASRRGALAGIAGFGLLAGFAPAAAFGQRVIALPHAPMKLTRRIERSLRGGERVVVARDWLVTFGEQGQGFSVTGHQIGCEVDAPSSLARLANFEQGRNTDDMWPVLLTGGGLIMASGNGLRSSDLEAAVAMAQQMIASQAATDTDERAEDRFLADMQVAGGTVLDALPDDLFFPSIGPIRAARSIELGNGMTGEFEVAYTARAVPEKGWLDFAERHVTTRLAGSVQTAREDWQLRPA